MSAAEVFDRWIAAINSHDVTALAGMMASNHVFTDSLGNRVQGASAMEVGWQGYFAMCPDYWIRADNVMVTDDRILAAGEAGGTIDGEGWRTPAAWRAVVRGGQVIEWQVFADSKLVDAILGRR